MRSQIQNLPVLGGQYHVGRNIKGDQYQVIIGHNDHDAFKLIAKQVIFKMGVHVIQEYLLDNFVLGPLRTLAMFRFLMRIPYTEHLGFTMALSADGK